MSFFSRFALAAASAVVLILLIDVLVVGGLTADSRAWYAFLVRAALYALAAVASAIAAAKFGWWREHIGRAWTLFALEFVCLLVNYILRRAAPDARLALEATLVAANVAQIGAYWLMARIISAAGIGYVISRARRAMLTAAALALAVALCHVSLAQQWGLLLAGDIRLGSAISVLADVITFTLAAPLALSALALRGGQISWIFGFLTISVFGWMINTGAPSVADLLGGGPDALRSTRLAGIAIATLFNTAAAAAQVAASARAMKGVEADA